MKDTRRGKPVGDQLRHAFPCEPIFLTAPPKRSAGSTGLDRLFRSTACRFWVQVPAISLRPLYGLLKGNNHAKENNADGTTLITINRPERRNAICAETALMLQKAFRDFERSSTQKAAVLTGAGNEAFSGGADTGEFPELWRCIPTVGFETKKPIISAVGGWCVGGALVLSMMCDLTVAARMPSFPTPKRDWVLRVA